MGRPILPSSPSASGNTMPAREAAVSNERLIGVSGRPYTVRGTLCVLIAPDLTSTQVIALERLSGGYVTICKPKLVHPRRRTRMAIGGSPCALGNRPLEQRADPARAPVRSRPRRVLCLLALEPQGLGLPRARAADRGVRPEDLARYPAGSATTALSVVRRPAVGHIHGRAGNV